MEHIEMHESTSLTGNPSGNPSFKESKWYQRKTLVKEVFYVQTIMIFTVVIASIVNIAMGVSDCDQQMWVLFLSSAVGHLLPSPDIGKKLKADPMIVSSSSSSDKKSNFSISTWHKRTIQHREVFYVQTLLVYAVILTSIVNLSLNVGEKNIWIILLSGSFAQMLPSPKFGKKKASNNG